MMKLLVSLLLPVMLLTACQTTPPFVSPEDRVLVFTKAYDYVYLKSLEAIVLPSWDIYDTDQRKGLIRISNNDYGNAFDADKRMITVIVTRASRTETTVELSKDSQKIIGAKAVLDAIEKSLQKYLS